MSLRTSRSARALWAALLPAVAAASVVAAGPANAYDAAACVSLRAASQGEAYGMVVAKRSCANADFLGYLQVITASGKVWNSPETRDPGQYFTVGANPGRVCARAWERKPSYYIPRGETCIVV